MGSGETVTANFALEELALGLDEIVVTGTAGAARRREIGNSIAQINVAELPDRPVQMVDLLQGAAPGLDLSATGGRAGGCSRDPPAGQLERCDEQQPHHLH